jgi:type II secretory pathway component PulM
MKKDTLILVLVVVLALLVGYIIALSGLSNRINDTRTELAQVREELAEVRERAEMVHFNTHVNAECLQTIKKHWPGARHEQLEFMAEVITKP